MFVFYVIMLIISCTDLRLCIEIHESQTCLTVAKNSSIMEKFLSKRLLGQSMYSVTFRENKASFLAKRTVAFFFEERASQTRALGPVSTV